MKKIITIHYGEIALKRGKRSFFGKCLMDNIKSSLAGLDYGIEEIDSRIVVFCSADICSEIGNRLESVFGIEWFSEGLMCNRDIDDIFSAAKELASDLDGSIKVACRRSDKSFSMKSPEISREIGIRLDGEGISTALRDAKNVIRIDVVRQGAILTARRKKGLRGLPVGSSGNVLSLLSGGIDSPVSSWLMMKRGCSIDFLHVHSFSSPDEAEASKMAETVRILKRYHPGKIRLFLVPYTEFYKHSFDLPGKSEMVLFRRFIIRLANRIADEHGHLGLVMGDSIGQVASQTLENLRTTSEASELPIYRPLVSYDKNEIIETARKIKTYDISIEEYKDCCSLVAHKHPDTKVRLEDAKVAEQNIKIEEIIDKSLSLIRVMEF
jgi:thiamine biosynthesis protein ThiI